MKDSKNQKYLPSFKEESYERIQKIIQELLILEKGDVSDDRLRTLQREMHTIKGTARMLQLEDINHLAHNLEDVFISMLEGKEKLSAECISQVLSKIDNLKKNIEELGREEHREIKEEELLKIPAGKIERLSTLSFDAALEVRQLENSLDGLKVIYSFLGGPKGKSLESVSQLQDSLRESLKDFSDCQKRLDILFNEIQRNIQILRIVPLSNVLKDFSRLVRDLSVKESKHIQFRASTGSLGIDKSIEKEVRVALIHIINNSVRHGIEVAEERQNLNKPADGTIEVSAYLKANRVFLQINDDGKGIDPDAIKEIALKRKLVDEKQLEKMSYGEIIRLILEPGFSSSESVDTLSGRGVGLDAVRKNIENLGGEVDIESKQGSYTNIILSLPLTVGLVPSVLVKSGGQTFAVPNFYIKDFFEIKSSSVVKEDKALSLKLNGSLLSLVKLSEFLDLPLSERQKGILPKWAVVLQSKSKKLFLGVDEILEEKELLLKKFGGFIGKVSYLIGGAILSEGAVCLILDIPEIFSTNALIKE